MHAFTRNLKRLVSVILALLAAALILSIIVWPPMLAHLLHSRLAVGLVGVWCAAASALLHPEFWSRLTYVIHEFRRGVRQGLDDLDDLFQ